jgi:hypothetical protein
MRSEFLASGGDMAIDEGFDSACSTEQLLQPIQLVSMS